MPAPPPESEPAIVNAIFILNAQVAVSLISTIRDLHRRRARERRGLSLAEGVRLVEEALAAGVAVEGAAISPALEATPRGATLKQRLTREGVRLEAVDDEQLAELADTRQPQGIVAVVRPREWRLAEMHPGPRGIVLVVDGVQDPGNVGALARAALGLGAAGLIALPGTADLTNPKTLRGSMGALFRLPAVHAETEACLAWARAEATELWTTAIGGTPVHQVSRTGPIALVLGNEGAGVRPELAAAASRSVAVPLTGGVESLNVAVAAGIILYEVTRDR
jgi:TrmH family RNA methyltransferase